MIPRLVGVLPLLLVAGAYAAELDSLSPKIKSAGPGDTIVVPSGTFKDAQITFDSVGETDRPITLRAAEAGKSIFVGKSSLTIAGKNLVVDGILFTGDTTTTAPPIVFSKDSSNCRLTNSAILDFKADFDDRFHYVLIGGDGHRVDHCMFTGKANRAPVLAADGGQHVHVDHNYFKDIPFHPRNGREIIQIVGIGSNDEPLEAGGAYWLVEQNLFDHADGEGAEIISLKSNFNVIRNNTVRASRGAFTMRSGGGNTFEGNFFFGEGAPGTNGLRISGRNAKAVNNYISGVTGTAIRLHAGEYIQKDVSGGYVPLNRRSAPLGRVAHYLQLIDGVVANNIVVDTKGTDLEFGGGYGNGWPKTQLILEPDNLTFANNLFVARENADRKMLQLRLPDDKAQRLPADAKPRPAKGDNNFLFGAQIGAEQLPEGFVFRTDDPKLQAAPNELLIPSADSPAIAGGFDPKPFQTTRSITAADVGPEWKRER